MGVPPWAGHMHTPLGRERVEGARTGAGETHCAQLLQRIYHRVRSAGKTPTKREIFEACQGPHHRFPEQHAIACNKSPASPAVEGDG